MKYLLTLCCLIFNISAFTQITFQKSYGGISGENNECNAKTTGIINTTSDSGYVICHSSISYGLPFSQGIYFLRLDKYGDTVFAKTFYRNDQHCFGRTVYQTSDGGFILGVSYSSGSGLVKTDGMGNIIWSKKLSQHIGYYGMPSAGNTYSFNSAFDYAMYLTKVDLNGNMLYQNRYHTIDSWYNGYEKFMLYSSYECANTDIISAGYYMGIGTSDGEFLLMRTDSAGNIKFVKSYSSDIYFETAFKVIELADKSIVAAGHWGEIETAILKTDSMGNPIFFKRISDPVGQAGNSVTTDDKNNIYLAGTIVNSGIGYGMITKLDPPGNILWSKAYLNSDVGLSIVKTYDEGMVLGGETTKFGAGGYDVYVCKADSNGDAGCDIIEVSHTNTSFIPTVTNHTLLVVPDTVCSDFHLEVHHGTIINTKCQNFTLDITEEETNIDLLLYPNPATEFLNIDLINISLGSQIMITDLSGKLVYQNVSTSAEHLLVDVHSFKTGMYLVKMIGDKGRYVGKFIKE